MGVRFFIVGHFSTRHVSGHGNIGNQSSEPHTACHATGIVPRAFGLLRMNRHTHVATLQRSVGISKQSHHATGISATRSPALVGDHNFGS